MLSELIEIRNRIDALIAAQQTQESSTTKKYTRSDDELVYALMCIPFNVMPTKRLINFLDGKDFMVVN